MIIFIDYGKNTENHAYEIITTIHIENDMHLKLTDDILNNHKEEHIYKVDNQHLQEGYSK